MQGVSGLLCVCVIFILLPQANCQTYSNVILNTWYEGSVNSSSGTISYQVSLPDHYKNNQTLFRIYNQITDKENKNALCTEVLTPVPNYEPAFCYSKPSSPQPLCVSLGDYHWDDKNSFIVLVDCNAATSESNCDTGVNYKVFFSYITATSCSTTGIPNLEASGFGAWLFIIIVVVIAVVILFIVAGGLWWYCSRRKKNYEILQDE